MSSFYREPGKSLASAHLTDGPSLVGTDETGAPERFDSLGLSKALMRAVLDEGYTQPTPVQLQVIPHVLARSDVLACAQTGTGKTAAFVLPILELLAQSNLAPGPIRALILTPTRELAAQVAERVAAYGRYLRLRHALVYGGVSQFRQVAALRKKPEVLVATPGRLLDLLRQGQVNLGSVVHFVLDEADRMLDMGFIDDVRRIAQALPNERQTLLFSATIPRPIESLARNMLKQPVRISVSPKVATPLTVDQAVAYVTRDRKAALLERMLGDGSITRAIVFTRTKRGANRVSQQLCRAGIDSEAIHGNKSQSARERALDAFRRGRARVLVATDIAARGIDVDGVSHVINYDLPDVAESYVHRVGRTGRAGAVGRAISFCDPGERQLIGSIERLIGKRIAVLAGEPTDSLPRETRSNLASKRFEPGRPRRPSHPASRHNRHQPRPA